MPTSRPRYAITDTGKMARMLDDAQQRWPDVHDRRELLLRLAATGHDAIASDAAARDRAARLQRQREALSRARSLVDVDELLSDAAWR
ncbi:hypothetical protein DVA67_004475 [Solirubrobacter sp. CPCC 204708]|uniref:Uncharacterized protein n=1 Tax=Solirubrobacter deserti TaxID=2282478 RepID=A0ABT4RHD3_9ACTN|nr:hypothetical protein [Solirubrobacter deserti]MBE2315216.1 hypothetical protein [Solirubrobacter deserti]MDA0137900.1 hypothetical protein [Solirubrobacter deserti]